MTIQPKAHAIGPVLGIIIPLGIYIVLLLNPAWDPLIQIPTHHFSIVSFVALIAAGIAIAVGIAGRQLRNLQVTFLAMAFISLALVFAIHGLATPGFILPRTPLPGIAAQLSVLLTAFWIWMSSLPSDNPLIERLARWQPLLVPLWTAVLLLLLLLSLAAPELVARLAINRPPLSVISAILTVGLSLTAAYRYWQSYKYSRFPLQLSIVYAAGWLAVGQVSIYQGHLWRLSWWLYHFLFLAAVVLLVSGLLVQYGSGTSIGTAVRGLFASDPMERLEAGISPSVRALVVATEAKDRYTAGHSFRVALSAVHVGAAMGLPPEKLRALAQGGIVHDVGKIEVPDRVLNKPAALTPEERQMIEHHPVAGFEMCARLGFMPDELDVIRSHHERWDGSGYPDGLRGEAVPLLARILAIADVYDALTSRRSYRSAWSHEEAVAYIRQHAGSQFDPQCVKIWEQLAVKGVPESAVPAWSRTAEGVAPLQSRPTI